LATPLDYQTTGLGGHAGEETDPAFATTVGGLKGSFHFSISFMLNLLCF